MLRWACVDLPHLALQLLLGREPAWKGRPVALICGAETIARRRILDLNGPALRAGLRPGMRLVSALSLQPDLCSGVLSEGELVSSLARIAACLHRHSPRVLPSAIHPGAFWLDVRGMELLHPSMERWGVDLRADLHSMGFLATVVIGHERFSTWAITRSIRGIRLLLSPHGERRAARAVLLVRLGLSPGLHTSLERLGVRTLGDYLRLPAADLRQRYGLEAERFHEMASGAILPPITTTPDPEPAATWEDLDDPERNEGRLLLRIERLLHPLLARLASRQMLLAALQVHLSLDHAPAVIERIRPAQPTLEPPCLLGLLRLRIEGRGLLQAGVIRIALLAEEIPAAPEQLRFFSERPPRDPAAASRALASVRAELGEQAVVYARLRDAYLPEARFVWEPVDVVRPARPSKVSPRPLIRRLLRHPRSLPCGRHAGVIELGPCLLSWGWWRSSGPVERDYVLLRAGSGALLWAFHDRRRMRWYLHGRVE